MVIPQVFLNFACERETHRPVARLPSGGLVVLLGCVSERRRREDRGAAGAEGVGAGGRVHIGT